MSAGLLLYAVAGSVAIGLMVGAIARDALRMRRFWVLGDIDADDATPAPWYAAALMVSVGLFLVGALTR